MVLASQSVAYASNSGEHPFLEPVLLGLVLVLLGAKVVGELFERLGQPAVLGEILAGIGLGNLGLLGFHGFDFLRTDGGIHALAELGVVILLFEVGLESDIARMRKVGASAFVVASLGVVAPFLLGWGLMKVLYPHVSALAQVFVGVTLCATSVGITARVLKDLKQVGRPEAQIVLGAAVIDDVMGLVALAVVSGLIQGAVGGTALSVMSVALIVGKSLLFLGGALWLGRQVSPRLFGLAAFLNGQHILLATSLAFCFTLALLASQIGLAPIVGAFAAGLILDELHYEDLRVRGDHTIEELIHPISGFLVPVFFVVTGSRVDLAAIGNPQTLLLAGGLTFCAVLGKQVCALGVLEKGLDRLSVGIGMIPRGEVGLIFANVGLTLKLPDATGQLQPVVDTSVFGAIVLMVMTTTVVTPPILKWSLCRPRTGSASDQPGAS